MIRLRHRRVALAELSPMFPAPALELVCADKAAESQVSLGNLGLCGLAFRAFTRCPTSLCNL
jgi:hypothetical protein